MASDATDALAADDSDGFHPVDVLIWLIVLGVGSMLVGQFFPPIPAPLAVAAGAVVVGSAGFLLGVRFAVAYPERAVTVTDYCTRGYNAIRNTQSERPAE